MAYNGSQVMRIIISTEAPTKAPNTQFLQGNSYPYLFY